MEMEEIELRETKKEFLLLFFYLKQKAWKFGII